MTSHFVYENCYICLSQQVLIKAKDCNHRVCQICLVDNNRFCKQCYQTISCVSCNKKANIRASCQHMYCQQCLNNSPLQTKCSVPNCHNQINRNQLLSKLQPFLKKKFDQQYPCKLCNKLFPSSSDNLIYNRQCNHCFCSSCCNQTQTKQQSNCLDSSCRAPLDLYTRVNNKKFVLKLNNQENNEKNNVKENEEKQHCDWCMTPQDKTFSYKLKNCEHSICFKCAYRVFIEKESIQQFKCANRLCKNSIKDDEKNIILLKITTKCNQCLFPVYNAEILHLDICNHDFCYKCLSHNKGEVSHCLIKSCNKPQNNFTIQDFLRKFQKLDNKSISQQDYNEDSKCFICNNVIQNLEKTFIQCLNCQYIQCKKCNNQIQINEIHIHKCIQKQFKENALLIKKQSQDQCFKCFAMISQDTFIDINNLKICLHCAIIGQQQQLQKCFIQRSFEQNQSDWQYAKTRSQI